jgi:hypothetical protein
MKQIMLQGDTKKQIFELEIDQLSILSNLDTQNNADFNKELKKKYNAYKNQDKVKHKFDEEKHITYSQMIKKLHDSQLKCYYCNCSLLILFNKKRDGSQWTLERLDNNLGHYESNTCIACLKCNLKRRTDSHEYFKQGKQLQLIKLE